MVLQIENRKKDSLFRETLKAGIGNVGKFRYFRT